ncbi:MAG: type IV pilus assembly protein PilM [Candidatus Omnitrophota bacterium]
MLKLKELFSKSSKVKTNLSVGLDIGNSSIKVVQLRTIPSTQEKELIKFDICPFKSRDKKGITDAIKSSFGCAQITTNIVQTSVSGQSVIVRYIQMPRMSKVELANALKLGLGKYIPFNVNEVNYDFQILDTANKADKMMRVLLVAVKKEVVQERIDVLKEAGLIPIVIDVDSFAIVNSFQLVSQENKGIIAVLDIGADVTSTTILVDNIPHFNRDVLIGGNHLTKAIIQEYDMSIQEADDLKHNPQTRYGDLIAAIRPVLDLLANEMHLSFNYCESQLGGSVRKIFLTGGTAKFKGIDKVLNSILGVDVEIWDPTRILKINEALPKDRLMDVGPLLTVAVGLALRG